MKTSLLSALKGIFLFVSLFIQANFVLQGQATQFSYFYRVYMKDKGAQPFAYQLGDLFSDKSVERRKKAGITAPDMLDIPVNKAYLNEIASKGFVLHTTSRWLNTGLFKTTLPADVTSILALPFVKEVKLVKRPGIKSKFIDKLSFETVKSEQAYDRPITQVNGYALHNQGYNGLGILIAVLDGGFLNADKIEALDNIRKRNGILATRNFVQKNNFVYDASNHGTAVMTVLAGQLANYIAGTSPGADFILIKTEDVLTEFPCEEDFWAAGAEYADSVGVDIISSSLGYTEFDDPSMNYKHSDLNGNTAFVTKAADIAASKGIIVVNSAGNERDNTWQKIICPADGDSVIAVGAVDANNVIAPFSSTGPSADGRVKPDNSAMGVAVPVQTTSGYISKSNGTSFSCPVLSGMTACLLQAVPQATVQDVIDALHQSGDRAASPDSLYGYGIPDMGVAYIKLQEKFLPVSDEDLLAYPNPTTGSFSLVFKQAPGSFIIDIVNEAGKIIYKKNYQGYPGRLIRIDELQNQPQGIYFVKVTADGSVMTTKIIKLSQQ
jgi:hypothetical protein